MYCIRRNWESAQHAIVDCGKLDTPLSYFWTATIASPPHTWSAWWARYCQFHAGRRPLRYGSAFPVRCHGSPRLGSDHEDLFSSSPSIVILLFTPAFCDGTWHWPSAASTPHSPRAKIGTSFNASPVQGRGSGACRKILAFYQSALNSASQHSRRWRPMHEWSWSRTMDGIHACKLLLEPMRKDGTPLAVTSRSIII